MNVRMLSAAAALCAGAMAAAVAAPTDASWVDPERATATVAAGTVSAPATGCEGRNGAPNVLRLAPGEGGVDVVEYVVTLTTDGDVPRWDAGTTPDGYPLLASGDPVTVPAGTPAVAWGITGGWSVGYSGEIAVAAVSAGGWISDPVSYDWTIEFDWLGVGYGACAAR